MIERRMLAMTIVVFSSLTWACASDASLVMPSSTSSSPPAAVLTISGRVTERSTPVAIAGARVTVQAGSMTGPSAVTDGSGFYSITGLKTGHVTVSVKAENYVDRSESIDVAAGSTRLDFQLMPASEN